MATPSHRCLRPDSCRQLDVYRLTLELISVCRPLSERLRRFNRRLGAQLTESLTSTLQNLAEGMRRTGKDRAHLLTVVLGALRRGPGRGSKGPWPSASCPRPSRDKPTHLLTASAP